MTNFQLIPLAAAAAFPIVTIYVLINGRDGKTIRWVIPALFGLLFFFFSVVTIEREGLLGFWPNHSQGFWGNQVWVDLLLALGIAWCLIVPKAKSLGMKLPLWLLFISCSGSIGLLAMFSRFLYLSDKSMN